jgi:hypothetical protein
MIMTRGEPAQRRGGGDHSTGGVVAGALAKGSRITGEQRQALGAELAQRYSAGESIRSIAESTGRSFGFVHGLVKEAGVTLRGRGGATRGAAVEAARATSSVPGAEPAADEATAGPGRTAKARTDKVKSSKSKAKPVKSKKDESKKDESRKSKKGKR